MRGHKTMETKRKHQNEVNWVKKIELKGVERKVALQRANEIISKEWKLKMPRCKPLPLHFGTNNFYRIGEIEYWIVNDTINNYCGKFLFMFDGQRCPSHYHLMKDETFFVVRGKIKMTAGSKRFTMRAGNVFKMKPRVKHTFLAVDGPALILEVSLPSSKGDNVFEDHEVGNIIV